MKVYTIMMNIIKRSIGSMKGFLVLILVPGVVISSAVILFGGNSQDAVHRVHIANQDQGVMGDWLIRQLDALPNYILFKVEYEGQLHEKIVNRKTNETLLIPQDFTAKLLTGEKAEVKMLVVSREPLNASFEALLNEMVAGMQRNAEVAKQTAGPDTTEDQVLTILEKASEETAARRVSEHFSEEKIWENSNDRQIGEVNRIMLLFIMGIVSQSVLIVVSDWKQGVMSRMFLAPVRSRDIMLGNFMGCFLIGTLQILFMLVITRYLFDYHYGGIGVLHQLVILELFLLASLGLACLVGGAAKESGNTGFIQLLVVIPTSMLGGCFWSIDDMPPVMQRLANFVPQSWALDAIGKLEDGASLLDIGLHLSILAAFAGVLLLFGIQALKPARA